MGLGVVCGYGKKNTYGKMRDKKRCLVQFSSSPRVMGTGIQAKKPLRLEFRARERQWGCGRRNGGNDSDSYLERGRG